MSLDHSRIVTAPPVPVIPGCARLGAGPQSITTIGAMDSGLAREKRAPRNDESTGVANPAGACEHWVPQTIRTKIRPVRCGRNYEQADHRAHEAKTPIQRVVQQPA